MGSFDVIIDSVSANIKKYVVGSIIGASAGPGTLVVNYFGRSKTEQMI